MVEANAPLRIRICAGVATHTEPAAADQRKRILVSAFFWVIGVTGAALVLALLLGRPAVLLFVPLLYALQVFRIAMRRGPTLHGLRASAMLMLAKFADAAGATRFFLERRRGHSIEYKAS